MTCGLYEIVHESGKRYIGSSKRIERRWSEHRKQLRARNHHARYLQHAWDRHGEEAFKFRILLVCAEDMLTFYEQCLLDGLRPAYNGSSRADKRRPLDATIRKQMSDAARTRRAVYDWKGQSRCLSEIAELEGIPANTLISRVLGGQPVAEAVAAGAPRPMNALFEHDGRAQTRDQWAAELGIHPRRMHYWLASGMSVRDCIARLNRREKALSLSQFCKIWGISDATVKSRLKVGASIGHALREPLKRDQSWRQAA